MPEKKTEDVEPDPAFDAKSAEVADVAQQGDAEIQTIGAEEVGKIDDLFGDAPPPPPAVPAPPGDSPGVIPISYANLEQRVVSLEIELAEIAKRVVKGIPKLEEKISKVGSAQHDGELMLSEALAESVTEHHNRLLQLEMRVTRLYGDEEA